MKSIYAIILLICGTAFAIDPSVYFPYQTPKILLYIIIPISTIIFIFLYHLILKKPVTVSFSVIECLLLTQLLWSVISNPGILTNTSTLDLFPLLAFVLVVCIVRQIQVREQIASGDEGQIGNKSSLLLIMRTIWIVGVCQALIGFAQYYTIFDHLPIGTGKTRMLGTIGAANGYGTFLAMSIMAVIIEFIHAPSTKWKIGLLISAVVLLSALIFNGSRGALMALTGGIVVFILLNRKKWDIFFRSRHSERDGAAKIRFVLPIVFLGAVMSGLVFYLYHLNVESSKGRTFVWSVSAPMIADHPIAGVGAGRYSVEYLNYQSRFFQDPSNQQLAYKAANIKLALSEYVQVLCESGIAGGVVFIMLWGSVLWFFFSNKRQAILSTGAASALVIVLLHMAVDTSLHIIPISIIAACFLGFTPVPSRWAWQFHIPSRNLQLLSFCILAAFAGLVVILSAEYYRGRIHWQRGYELSMQHRWQFAIQEYEKAVEELPEEGELLFHLGAAQVMMNSYSKGIYHLQQARLWYNDRNMYLSLSKGYLGLHQYAEAERYAQQALAMFPDHLAPHLLLGEIYFKMERTKESKESLQKCIGRKTAIQSDEVEQIGIEAEALWKQYYKKENENSIFQ